jgi:hypothetical protein
LRPGAQAAAQATLRAFTLAAAAMLAGCAAPAVDPYGASTVPVVLTGLADAGVRDLRAPYREAVCRRLTASDGACADVLLQLPGEGQARPSSAPGDLAERYRIAFVPGFLSECFDTLAHPFAGAEKALRSSGFTVDYLQVPGRGSTAENARRLATHFAALSADARPIIIFAYSKGLPDVLAFVAAYPQAAKRIAAVVSVAGAFNGSPLADDLLPHYREWVAAFPLPGCEVGTGEELQDLRRDVRLAWWQKNRQAVTLPIFSLVATPRPEQISPAGLGTYRWLAKIDPRNDSKLLWTDQIVPGGFLLGYVNADHWAIAIPITEALPGLAFMFRDKVPRAALVEAAIEVVAETLASSSFR